MYIISHCIPFTSSHIHFLMIFPHCHRPSGTCLWAETLCTKVTPNGPMELAMPYATSRMFPAPAWKSIPERCRFCWTIWKDAGKMVMENFPSFFLGGGRCEYQRFDHSFRDNYAHDLLDQTVQGLLYVGHQFDQAWCCVRFLDITLTIWDVLKKIQHVSKGDWLTVSRTSARPSEIWDDKTKLHGWCQRFLHVRINWDTVINDP